jgi:2-methylisocitrate lyase-like PEP mutase family enzyme
VLTTEKRKTTAFKELINRGKPYLQMFPRTTTILKMMEQLGYEASSVPGTVVQDITNRPDDNTRTMSETVQIVRYFTSATKLPLWVDVDVCFGGIFQVERTVKELINAGAAGMMMEDQPVDGKRFGGMVGKTVIPMEDAVAKFRVAVDTKNAIDPDFQIIARCDALGAANAGTIEETIERMQAYKATGADALSFEAPRTREEIRQVRNAVTGPMTCTQYGLDKEMTLAEAEDYGLYSVVFGGGNQQLYRVIWELLKAIQVDHHKAIDDFLEMIPNTEGVQFNRGQAVGLNHIQEMEEKYLPKDRLDKYAFDPGGHGKYDPTRTTNKY